MGIKRMGKNKKLDKDLYQKLQQLFNDAIDDVETIKVKAVENPEGLLADYGVEVNDATAGILESIKHGELIQMAEVHRAMQAIQEEIKDDEAARKLLTENPAALLSKHGVDTRKLPSAVLEKIAGGGNAFSKSLLGGRSGGGFVPGGPGSGEPPWCL